MQALGLPLDIIRIREIDNIDIGNEKLPLLEYNKTEDPKFFRSEKTGRGPLSGGWPVSDFIFFIPQIREFN